MTAAAPDPIGVTVTLTQIYETLRGVEAKVSSIETKLDTLATSSSDHESRIRAFEQAVPKDINTRVAVLENHHSWSRGAIAAFGTVSAVLGGTVTAIAGRLLG